MSEGGVPMIQAESLRGYRGMRHGFFSRLGGVSAGGYASLNGSAAGDLPDSVGENRRRVAHQLGVAATHLVTPKQLHGVSVAEVEGPWPDPNDPPEHDALVTRAPGLAVGVLTADCAPILLADLAAGVVGAAHAGWRGALGGVVEATVGAMEKLRARADRMVAVVGPTIAQASYEVRPEFQAEFVTTDPASAPFFTASPKDAARFQFDLPEYVGARLIRAGLRRIEVLELDTLSDASRFFSHRRSTLRGETEVGRQMSAIVLVNEG
jgi:YfiH family protein